jgi:hypothetical protein
MDSSEVNPVPSAIKDNRNCGKAKQVDSADDFELVTWLVIKG